MEELEVIKNDTQYQFHSLTPIDNVDLGIYESAINFAFSDNSVKNVALSGSYGSGKSSVLSTYEKQHKDKKFIHLSLAHFNSTDEREKSADKDKVQSESEKSSDFEKILEGKILNQLLHQIPQNKIPLTNFKIKKKNSAIQNIIISVLAVLSVLIGLLLIFHTQWAEFVKTIQTEYLKNILLFSVKPEASLMAGIILFAISLLFVYKLIKWITINHMIKKLSVKDLEIEVLGDNKESYFDQYLNDALYLFESAEADAIVFEDIDRYESSKIFERLHEINTLVNADKKNHLNFSKQKLLKFGENKLLNFVKKILLNFGKKKIVRFFYLIRDDIFENKDRIKFFDFIIPIVPVIDNSNSYDKFLEFLNSGDEKEAKIDPGFLKGLSLYVDDMRVLQNICNEFLIYRKLISTTGQDLNKMLAIIAYKNTFPSDFADLQLRKGFVFEIIGGNGNERLIADEKSNFENAIVQKRKQIEGIQNEMLTEDELSVYYAKKAFQNCNYNSYSSNWYKWDTNECKKQLLSNNPYVKAEIINEYKNRIKYTEKDPQNKENRILGLENEINKLNSEIICLEGLRISEIINRENIDEFFSKTVFKSETGLEENFELIKESPYFDMLKYLIREGYINETYADYMTHFYAKSLSHNDKIFLRSITDRKAKEYTHKLEKLESVADWLLLPHFSQEETLNYSLFEYLLDDYVNKKNYQNKTLQLIQQIKNKSNFEFIIYYAATSKNDKCNLVIVFSTEWKSFICDLFDKYGIVIDTKEVEIKLRNFIKQYAYTLFSMFSSNEQFDEYFDQVSKSLLKGYVSNDSSFLDYDVFLTKMGLIRLCL